MCRCVLVAFCVAAWRLLQWASRQSVSERVTHTGLSAQLQISTSGLLWLCGWVLGPKLTACPAARSAPGLEVAVASDSIYQQQQPE